MGTPPTSPGSVDVREARDVADLDGAARLRWRWVVVEGGATTTVVQDEDSFVAAALAWARDRGEAHRCFVAARGDDVVGVAWLALTPRVPSPRSLDRWSADVQSVYVVPEERGHGLGGRLVAAVLTAAREAGAERVVVHSSGRAVPLYARAGFEESSRLRHAVLGVPGGPR